MSLIQRLPLVVPLVTVLLLGAGVAPAAAQSSAPDNPTDDAPAADTQQFRALEAETRRIKAEVLDLEAELAALENDIRYPAATRWTVFVTTDAEADDVLRVIELQVDGQTVASHEYSAKERSALADGGAHRLYLGNLSPGRHELAVRLGRGDKAPTPGPSFIVDKQRGPQLLELRWQPGTNTELAHTSYADTTP